MHIDLGHDKKRSGAKVAQQEHLGLDQIVPTFQASSSEERLGLTHAETVSQARARMCVHALNQVSGTRIADPGGINECRQTSIDSRRMTLSRDWVVAWRPANKKNRWICLHSQMSVFTVELWETAGRLWTGLFGAPCTSPIVRALYPILIVGWLDGRRPLL